MEPVGLALGAQDDPHSIDNWIHYWKPIIAQRTALVCFKNGSNDIVGANLLYVKSKGDNFLMTMMKVVWNLFFAWKFHFSV